MGFETWTTRNRSAVHLEHQLCHILVFVCLVEYGLFHNRMITAQWGQYWVVQVSWPTCLIRLIDNQKNRLKFLEIGATHLRRKGMLADNPVKAGCIQAAVKRLKSRDINLRFDSSQIWWNFIVGCLLLVSAPFLKIAHFIVPLIK